MRRCPPLAFRFGARRTSPLIRPLCGNFCPALPRQVPWPRNWAMLNIPGAMTHRGRQRVLKGPSATIWSSSGETPGKDKLKDQIWSRKPEHYLLRSGWELITYNIWVNTKSVLQAFSMQVEMLSPAFLLAGLRLGYRPSGSIIRHNTPCVAIPAFSFRCR